MLRTIMFLTLAGLAASACAQPAAVLPGNAERTARVEQLIRQLGDDSFEKREAASKALVEIGNPARLALEKAAKSPDAETALRAMAILDRLPKNTHTLVDALGQPIPKATVALFSAALQPSAELPPPAEATPIATVVTDEDGRLAVPEVEDQNLQHSARVEHADYGLARCLVPREKETLLRVPLVKRGSEAHARSLSGQLVTQGGQPIAGASLRCDNVRTPGEGLIEPLYPRGEVLTDDEGRFACYLPSENRNRQRGELVPLNSRYTVTISVPDDDGYLPIARRLANSSPVRIEMPRATRRHRFRFEAVGGGWLEGDEQLRALRVQFEEVQDGERMFVPLDTPSLLAGRKLLPGKYLAQDLAGGKTVEYQPLVIRADSPEQLDFRLIPVVTYRGRVVDGVTDQPVAGAMVLAFRSSARNNLALLTADDWKLLAECPNNPPPDHAAIRRLNDFYGTDGLLRTDKEGRFTFTRQPDQQTYGLIAFAENRLPYLVRLASLKPESRQAADAGTFPLFPAAKVLVRPVFDGQSLPVSPQWLPEKSGQPDWFQRFHQHFLGSDRKIEYVHWLALNEMQPVFVPAGIRVRMKFDSPYDDKWTPADIDQLLQLEEGGQRELGDLRFIASLPASVRVVNSRGEPVEGFAVRRMYQGENAWSLAHNTDQQGLAHFHLRPNSQGSFRISDLPGPKETVQAKNLVAGFRIEATAPADPIQITVTDEQVKLLRGP